MKYIIFVFGILLFICPPVYAGEFENQQADAAGVDGVIEYYSKTVSPYLYDNGLEFDLEGLIDSIYERDFSFSPSGILNGILRLFTGSLKESFMSVGIIILMSVISGFLSSIGSLGGEKGTEAAFYVCFCVICTVCINAFVHSVSAGIEAIELMSDFVKISAPVLVTLTAASGQLATAAIFSPLLYSAASVAITASSGILMPLVYSVFSLSALNCVGEEINLDRMARLLKNISRWIMGLFLTVFSGISAIGSAGGGALNAVAGKTIRFAVGNFIPLVGGMLSDSVDMAAACTNVVRSAAGVGGAVVIALVFVACGARLVAQLWLFRIAAAVTAPVSDARIVKLFDDIADCISMVFASLCMCSFLFLVIVTFMIKGGTI